MLSVRVLTVDDFEPWRRFVSSTLKNHPEFHIICEVADGLDSVQKAEELQPDLVVLDIGLPKLNGIAAARQIRRVAPKSKIVFLTENYSSDIVAEALSTGARGYVVKSDAGRDLLAAVEAVVRDHRFVSARVARHDLFDTADAQKSFRTTMNVD
jgi:DNA-binding NarL/FixJ family response regulator